MGERQYCSLCYANGELRPRERKGCLQVYAAVACDIAESEGCSCTSAALLLRTLLCRGIATKVCTLGKTLKETGRECHYAQKGYWSLGRRRGVGRAAVLPARCSLPAPNCCCNGTQWAPQKGHYSGTLIMLESRPCALLVYPLLWCCQQEALCACSLLVCMCQIWEIRGGGWGCCEVFPHCHS